MYFPFNILVEIKRNCDIHYNLELVTLHLKLPSIWKHICQLGRDSFLKKHWGHFPGHADFQKSIILYHGIPSFSKIENHTNVMYMVNAILLFTLLVFLCTLFTKLELIDWTTYDIWYTNQTNQHSRFGHYFCSNLYGSAPRGPRGVKRCTRIH